MTDHPLLSKHFLLVAVSALAVAVGGLSSCQSDEDPYRSHGFFRGADVNIRGAGALEIRQTVVDVMTENDFRLASPFGNSMTFEKEGTRNDEWMYGSYGSRPMRQRVTVTLEIGDDPEIIRLVASGVVVREYSNMSGEETGGLFAGGAMRYSRYLDQIKARVEHSVRERPEL
jgi:hypothetical protein